MRVEIKTMKTRLPDSVLQVPRFKTLAYQRAVGRSVRIFRLLQKMEFCKCMDEKQEHTGNFIF